eukprot:TRINITY_DN34678_c0_g1_i2.p1 TRINITY_DN34678_c0_g1~~TRINITY_DN34678_c0_g1_i2.p1  ORF type:complete len:100 (-),score=3.27 TRINITY_DN34678_c0_g1_i2:283-582(-)
MTDVGGNKEKRRIKQNCIPQQSYNYRSAYAHTLSSYTGKQRPPTLASAPPHFFFFVIRPTSYVFRLRGDGRPSGLVHDGHCDRESGENLGLDLCAMVKL